MAVILPAGGAVIVLFRPTDVDGGLEVGIGGGAAVLLARLAAGGMGGGIALDRRCSTLSSLIDNAKTPLSGSCESRDVVAAFSCGPA
jgi:hypothetical protein